MFIIILLLIIIAGFVLFVLYGIFDEEESVKKNTNLNYKISVLTSTDGETFRESRVDDYKYHRELLRLRDKKRERKHTVWCVLRFMTAYKELMEESPNFYQFRENYVAFKSAKGEMRKRNPDTNALVTAIRFCQMEYYYGICNYKLTYQEIRTLYKWRDLKVDEERLLNKVLTSFDKYWKGVLDSYVLQSARTNRIKYLIKEFDSIKGMEELRPYPEILSRVDQMQQEYKDMVCS